MLGGKANRQLRARLEVAGLIRAGRRARAEHPARQQGRHLPLVPDSQERPRATPAYALRRAALHAVSREGGCRPRGQHGRALCSKWLAMHCRRCWRCSSQLSAHWRAARQLILSWCREGVKGASAWSRWRVLQPRWTADRGLRQCRRRGRVCEPDGQQTPAPPGPLRGCRMPCKA